MTFKQKSYETYNFDSTSRFFIVCEHASNYIPAEYKNLGLSEADLQKHIAWDVGAADVSRFLADKLNAPALLGTYSRLLVDINRPLDHPTLIVTRGEGQVIPGNLDLDEEEILNRIDNLYKPFHKVMAQKLDGILERQQIPFTINVHSFSPTFFSQKREWEICFLWAQDDRPVRPLIRFFRDKGFTVGDNEPYNAKMLGGTTLNRHCDNRRLPSLLVEIRHDLIDTPEKAENWADMLHEALSSLDEEAMSFYKGPLAEFDPEACKRYFDELIENIENKLAFPA